MITLKLTKMIVVISEGELIGLLQRDLSLLAKVLKRGKQEKRCLREMNYRKVKGV